MTTKRVPHLELQLTERSAPSGTRSHIPSLGFVVIVGAMGVACGGAPTGGDGVPVASIATRVALSPRFVAVNVGADATFSADAFDAAGLPIPMPVLSWTTPAAIATVNTLGVVRGLTAGPTIVAGRVNAAADTAVVAVLGTTSLLATAFIDGTYDKTVKPGQTITVPVVLDISRPSGTGDLGTAQFDMAYDPAVLTFLSASSALTGSTIFNSPSAGTFKFRFAHTAVQGSGALTLVTITFQVVPSAAVGAARSLTPVYVAVPTNTSFQEYSAPIVIGGRFRVAAS